MKKGKKHLKALRLVAPDLEEKRRNKLLADSKKKRRAEDYPRQARDFLDLYSLGMRVIEDFRKLPKCIQKAANKIRRDENQPILAWFLYCFFKTKLLIIVILSD